jgi:hypothetical protein
MLDGVGLCLVTDVSAKQIGPLFKDKAILVEYWRDFGALLHFVGCWRVKLPPRSWWENEKRKRNGRRQSKLGRIKKGRIKENRVGTRNKMKKKQGKAEKMDN